MSGFGDRLRQAREARDITLRQIADETKIGLRYLQALEADDLKSLPGTVFNKGYVRTYAEFVGVDPQPWVEAYLAEEKLQSEAGRLHEADLLRELSRSIDSRQPDRRRAGSRRTVLLGLGGVLVLLLGAGWWFILRPQTVQAPTASSTTGAVAGQSRSAAPQAEAATESTERATPSGSVAPSSTAPHEAPAPREPVPDPKSATVKPATQPIAREASTPEVVTSPVVAPPARQPSVTTPASAEPQAVVTSGRTTIPEFGIGTGVVQRQLVGRGDRFESGSRVWFWTRVTGGRAGETIRHVWIHEGREILSTPLTLGGPHWRTQSRKTLIEGTGSWAVEARDAAGRVLARETFTCLPRS